MEINLNQFLTSVSLALDLAGGNALDVIHLNHGRRVAYISLRLAQLLDLSYQEQLDLYYSALLHDIGITEAFLEYHAMETLIREHCLFGARNLSIAHIFSPSVKETVLNHHENWDGSGPFGKKDLEISIYSQIIRIADEVEIHFDKTRPNYQQRSSLKQLINRFKGQFFSKEISSHMLYLLKEERFWWDISFPNQDLILQSVAPKKRALLTLEELKELILVLAAIIDNKSSFTGEHTGGIAQKALILASSKDFSIEELTMLELGAYLHDLGKLSVPNSILEKPDKLNSAEFTIIKSHAYYTKFLINAVEGMEEIAKIAGNHHEKLDGTGYPEGLKAEDLSYRERVLCALDIYQALIEERPYRKSLPHSQAISIMREMVANRKIDGEITEEIHTIFG